MKVLVKLIVQIAKIIDDKAAHPLPVKVRVVGGLELVCGREKMVRDTVLVLIPETVTVGDLIKLSPQRGIQIAIEHLC
ncbi:hypothetical protein D3C78_1572350 [compost metagenome]